MPFEESQSDANIDAAIVAHARCAGEINIDESKRRVDRRLEACPLSMTLLKIARIIERRPRP